MTLSIRSILENAHWLDKEPSRLGTLPRCEIGFAADEASWAPDYYPKQVHGTTVVPYEEISALPPKSIEADGIFSTAPAEVVGVQTADCLPVLLSSNRVPFVAAVHAGWRGLAKGILAKTVDRYVQDYAGTSNDLVVCFGPAISLAKFEVGPEVVAAFEEPCAKMESTQLSASIAKGRSDRWHVSLQTVALFQLVNVGVDPTNVTVWLECTHQNQNWASYRRQGKGCKRNWTYASLLESN